MNQCNCSRMRLLGTQPCQAVSAAGLHPTSASSLILTIFYKGSSVKLNFIEILIEVIPVLKCYIKSIFDQFTIFQFYWFEKNRTEVLRAAWISFEIWLSKNPEPPELLWNHLAQKRCCYFVISTCWAEPDREQRQVPSPPSHWGLPLLRHPHANSFCDSRPYNVAKKFNLNKS